MSLTHLRNTNVTTGRQAANMLGMKTQLILASFVPLSPSYRPIHAPQVLPDATVHATDIAPAMVEIIRCASRSLKGAWISAARLSKPTLIFAAVHTVQDAQPRRTNTNKKTD